MAHQTKRLAAPSGRGLSDECRRVALVLALLLAPSTVTRARTHYQSSQTSRAAAPGVQEVRALEPGEPVGATLAEMGGLRELKDRAGVGQALNNLGLVYGDLGRNEKALGYDEQALVIWR